MQTPDFYTLIHKAIRLALCDFLHTLSVFDPHGATSCQHMKSQWLSLRSMLDGHSEHEDQHIHTLLQIAAPEILTTLSAQHLSLEQDLVAINLSMEAFFRQTTAEGKTQYARELYLAFTSFMSDYFEHLIEEETKAMPALIKKFSTQALFEAHMGLVSSLTPQERMRDLPFIIRSQSHDGRVQFLRQILPGMPVEAHRPVLALIEASLSPEDYKNLMNALELQNA